MELGRRPSQAVPSSGPVWELARALSAAVTTGDVVAAIERVGPPVVGAAACTLEVLASVDTERAAPTGADRCAAADRAEAGAMLVLPLRSATGEVIATLALEGMCHHGAAEERELLTRFVQVAAQALERALVSGRGRTQLAFAEQTQVDLLQSAFLPARLPETPGLEVAAAYLPASGAPIGGDWFDVLALPDGVCLVIGDVAGHGVKATAVMAQLRNAIRGFASDTASPASIVGRANRMLCRLEPDATATAVVALWPAPAGALVSASAGHPPPLRCRAGTCDYLGPPPAHPLLGAVAEQAFEVQRTAMRPGTTLLFYTDGLIEDRRQSLRDGLEDLRRFVESLDDLSPHRLTRAVVRWRGGRADRDDDLCVMAFRPCARRGGGRGALPERARSRPGAPARVPRPPGEEKGRRRQAPAGRATGSGPAGGV